MKLIDLGKRELIILELIDIWICKGYLMLLWGWVFAFTDGEWRDVRKLSFLAVHLIHIIFFISFAKLPLFPHTSIAYA